jgi:N-acetylglutamate synthase-like GNAT family acetyltransferase
MTMEIREPRSKEELEQLFDLRYRILREPWGQTRGSERDDEEARAFHLAAFDNGKVVGTSRLQRVSKSVARVRYMAVDENYRGKGIGGLLLEGLEKEAVRRGVKKLMLNAREKAVPFYERHGYTNRGEGEMLFGVIRHFKMEKALQ